MEGLLDLVLFFFSSAVYESQKKIHIKDHFHNIYLSRWYYVLIKKEKTIKECVQIE